MREQGEDSNSLMPGAFQYLASDGFIVERILRLADDLIILVPLTCYQDTVSAFGAATRETNRFLTILENMDRLLPRHAQKNFVDDVLRRFGSGIVGRHDDDISPIFGDPAHQRPLARISIPAATKDDPEISLRHVSELGQSLL